MGAPLIRPAGFLRSRNALVMDGQNSHTPLNWAVVGFYHPMLNSY